MSKQNIGLDEAYSLKTPDDSIELYKKWAKTYDKDFADKVKFLSPQKIAEYFNNYSTKTDTPILDIGAGTGLLAKNIKDAKKKEILAIDISPEMLEQAKLTGCYSSLIQSDLTKKIPLNDNSIGAMVSSGTFTIGHVGPEVFDELLRIMRPGGLFVFSIHSEVFKKNGFEEKFNEIENLISQLEFKEFNVYGDNKKNKHRNAIALAAIFRKNL